VFVVAVSTNLQFICWEWQSGLQDCVIPLPKPLTVAEADKGEGQVLENGKKSHEDLPSPEVCM